MALTLKRWIALMVVACGVVWIGFARRRAGPPIAGETPLNLHIPAAKLHLNAVARQLSQTNDRVRQLEIRDSLTSRYGTHTTPGLEILIDQSVPPGVSAELERQLRDKWRRLDIHSSTPVIAAIVLDSAADVHGFPRRHTSAFLNPISVFLPRTDGAPCLSVLRMSVSIARLGPQIRGTITQNLEAPETADAILGPCAYLARFGTPGPRVSEWLRATGWSLARVAAWDAPSPPWRPQNDAFPYWFREQIAALGDPYWQTRAVIGQSGLACIAGETGRCAEAAGAQLHATGRDTEWTNAVVNTHGASAYFLLFATKPSPLGADDAWLMSDMVRTLGDSAFRRFWTADTTVAEAFSEASGRSLDAWIREWARAVYGRVPTGPSLPPFGLAAGAVALLAGLALAIALERRRRVA